jgi:hypothetical protein
MQGSEVAVNAILIPSDVANEAVPTGAKCAMAEKLDEKIPKNIGLYL